MIEFLTHSVEIPRWLYFGLCLLAGVGTAPIFVMIKEGWGRGG